MPLLSIYSNSLWWILSLLRSKLSYLCIYPHLALIWGVDANFSYDRFWTKLFMPMDLPYGYLITHGTKTVLPDLVISRHGMNDSQITT